MGVGTVFWHSDHTGGCRQDAQGARCDRRGRSESVAYRHAFRVPDVRAFNRFRSRLASAGIARSRIKPAARLREVLPRRVRRHAWNAVRSSPEFAQLPPLRFGVGRFFAPITVADAFYTAVAYSAHSLKRPDEPWTREEVRQVVRAGVREISGLTEFADDAEIVRELGID